MRLTKRRSPSIGGEQRKLVPSMADELHIQLHALQNTLASLKLRLGVVAADPTCRFAQQQNLVALLRIVETAIEETHAIRAAASERRGHRRRARSPRT